MDIELYIGGELVDLAENTNILFNYKTKDLTNPTVLKNSFTKSVELVGTDRNNNIFGHIWDLQRVQNHINFNPSKRVEFKLFKNGELIETGYCKLDSIKREKVNTFYLTLFGGLGDWLYSLMYAQNGEKRKLSDLVFDYDLGFYINKDTVNEAWDSLYHKTLNKYQTINFAPCYNGLPEKLSADKVLVNTNGYNGPMRQLNSAGIWEDRSGFPDIKDTYKLYNGYGLAELPKEMSEWETRDLRSYLQRPVIRVKSIIEAICNPDNNGGYTVDLDKEFFSDLNPYFYYGWITLPLLKDLGTEAASEQEEWTVSLGQTTVTNSGAKGVFALNSSINRANVTYNMDVELDMDIQAWETSHPLPAGNQLYTSTALKTGSFFTTLYGGYAVQMVGIDANGNEVCGSNVAWLTTPIDDAGTNYLQFSEVTKGFEGEDFHNMSVQLQKGYFVKNGSKYTWNSIMHLSMKSLTNITGIRIKVVAGGKQELLNVPNAVYNSRQSSNSWILSTYKTIPSTLRLSNAVANISGESSLVSGSYVSQADLLATEYTPADYLLSFAKLFNLYFEKDSFEKKIYIKTQRNYYDGKKVDIEDLIDYSKPINITPLSFNSKWYEMQYATKEESSAEADYKSKYGTTYGVQKIDTGYEFDASTNNLLKDNIFNNAVQVQEISNYYSIRQSDYYNECPTFLYNNVTWKLMNQENDTTDINIAGPQRVIEGYFNRYSKPTLKYDAFPKVQLHNENEPNDGANVLLFFNGTQNVTSTSVYQPYYWLTDDVPEMLVMNDDKPCWLYTQSETDASGNTIGIRLTRLPQFSRYTTLENLNKIYYTWDLGRPKQIYLGNNMEFMWMETTIYERYWKKYLTDLYDVDTRVVEAYVKFDEPVVQDYLKHYYWWNNSYWTINEIIDYDPSLNESTKVKFVKINTLDSYTEYDPAEMPEGIVKLTLDRYYIGPEGGTITGYVYVDDNGPWYFDGQSEWVTTSIPSGIGSSYFTMTVAPNTDPNSRQGFLVVFAEYGDSVKFTQMGTASNFYVEPSVINLTGRTATIDVINPEGHTWNITQVPNWITVDVTGGTGYQTINITATDEGTDRSGAIVFYNSTTMQNYTVTVNQYSDAGVTGNTDSFNVTETGNYVNRNVPTTGATITYVVKSVAPWRCYTSAIYADPLEYTGTGNTGTGETIRVVWEESDRIYPRDATITFESELGNVVEVLKTQDSLTTLQLDFDATGGTKIINTLVSTTVKICPNWITVQSLENGFRLVVQSNGDSSRQGTIVIGRENDQDLTIYVNQSGTGSGGGSESGETPEVYITITPSAKTVSNITTATTFSYVINGSVTNLSASINVSWARVLNPDYGYFNIRLDQNNTLYDRTATITLSANDPSDNNRLITATATLTQFGSALSIEPEVLELDYRSGSQNTILIETDGEYTITIEDD